MNRIRLLSEQVANQIAAGEVVERPASAVKELVENALDAQAAQIHIEIQAGGRSLIRITDDGVGMNRDDALLCLERHATSKIQSADDLRAIATMGFRGEALPSIASVSRMTLTTREHSGADEAGTRIVIHGGKIQEVKEAGCAAGTSVEVRQLFYNLPARRKFLRSEETERAHVHHCLTLAALANPSVGFNFVQNSRIVWQLPPVRMAGAPPIALLRERLRAVYGRAEELLPVEFSTPLDSFARDIDSENAAPLLRIWGVIGAPGVARATREEQHLFVNRRPIQNRGLNYALLEGYHTALMKGRFPVCCLFLELDPSEVDVNIHPAKREVKFHQENAVRRHLAHAVRLALLDFHSRSGAFRTTSAPARPAPPPPSKSVRPESTPAESPQFPQTAPIPFPLPAAVDPPIHQDRAEPVSRPHQEPPLRSTLKPDERPEESPPSPADESQRVSPQDGTAPSPLLNVPLRLVGVIGKLYVAFESDRGLVLMDQHAAHERVLFEQMLDRLESGDAPSQRLLLPETIELSPKDAEFLTGHLNSLARLGVSLSEFGARTFLLDAVPPFVKSTDARKFVVDLIDELKTSGDRLNSWRLGEDTVAKNVCRRAVKANDELSVSELENLVADLRRCRMPYTCPHGRPTLIEINYRELEKKFGRTD